MKVSCNAARNTLQNTARNTCHSAIWKVANGRFFSLFFPITFLFWNPVHENIVFISKSWSYSWNAEQGFFLFFNNYQLFLFCSAVIMKWQFHIKKQQIWGNTKTSMQGIFNICILSFTNGVHYSLIWRFMLDL